MKSNIFWPIGEVILAFYYLKPMVILRILFLVVG